jgi:hypothetical protein
MGVLSRLLLCLPIVAQNLFVSCLLETILLYGGLRPRILGHTMLHTLALESTLRTNERVIHGSIR